MLAKSKQRLMPSNVLIFISLKKMTLNERLLIISYYDQVLCTLCHESVPSRSVLDRQHNRTVLTRNGSGSMLPEPIDVFAKTEPPVEHAPHDPAMVDNSFPNIPVSRTVL